MPTATGKRQFYALDRCPHGRAPNEECIPCLPSGITPPARVARTLFFKDNGQDFLEWDLDEDDRVVGCRPFQSWLWVGCTQVRVSSAGMLSYTRPGEKRKMLRHHVESIKKGKR